MILGRCDKPDFEAKKIKHEKYQVLVFFGSFGFFEPSGKAHAIEDLKPALLFPSSYPALCECLNR